MKKLDLSGHSLKKNDEWLYIKQWLQEDIALEEIDLSNTSV